MTDSFLPTRLVCARYNICERTLARWIERADLGFPAAVKINNKRYWHLEHLQHWERERAAFAARRPMLAPAASQSPPKSAPAREAH